MKRYAFFSDVHGNLYALKAVLEEIKNIGVDQIFSLGDTLFNHATTDEVIDVLDDNEVILIRGNHDEPLENKIGRVQSKHRAWVTQIENWLIRNTKPATRQRLSTLPITRELTLENGQQLLMFHAHPDNLWARINSATAPMEDIKEAFLNLPADILVYGHYHQPHIMPLNGKTLVNVASVDSHTSMMDDKMTRFTILESHPDRNIFTQYTLPYDSAAQDQIDLEKDFPKYFITED